MKQPLVVVALSAAVLLAAGYFGFRSRSAPDARSSSVASVPSTESRSSETSDAIITKRGNEPPGKAGDLPVQAPAIVQRGGNATGSFRRLRDCVYASKELVAAKALTGCKFYEGKPQYADAYAQCLNGWRDANNRIARAESALSECKGMGDTARRYFEATRDAAKKGDSDAQLCYVQAAFGRSDGTSPLSDADIEEYKKLASGYVDESIKRGDWRIVFMLATWRGYPGAGPVAMLDKIGQPETVYKMTKLLRLGASGSYARGLESDLNGMIHPTINPENALPQDIVREGDAWAEQTYSKYFSSLPSLTEDPVVCSPEPGRVGSLHDLTDPDDRRSP